MVVFERLSKESGAGCFFPANAGALDRAVQAVRRELDTQYTLAYYPAAGSKTYRRIRVKVLRSGLRVAARKGIGAADAGIRFSIDTCAIAECEHPYPYESKLTRDNGRLIYREDFSDPRSGWPMHEGSRYGSGEYHRVRSGRLEPAVEGSVAAYGPWWSDVRASVSAKFVAQNPTGGFVITAPAAGLVFRMNDRGYYALLISTRPGLYAELVAGFERGRTFAVEADRGSP